MIRDIYVSSTSKTTCIELTERRDAFCTHSINQLFMYVLCVSLCGASGPLHVVPVSYTIMFVSRMMCAGVFFIIHSFAYHNLFTS